MAVAIQSDKHCQIGTAAPDSEWMVVDILRGALEIGKTIVDSAGDILALSPLAKGTLKVGSEVMGIFRGD